MGAALAALAVPFLTPASAQDQGPNAGTDLYDRPVLAVDPGLHTAKIWAQAVDAAGRFAVTGGDDRTVRVWSTADGKLLRTIWIPVGPETVGAVYAVAISPDGSTIGAGGWTERVDGDHPIYLLDRESGNMIQRIHGDLPKNTEFLTFSPDGRYLAATLYGSGLRVFDRDKHWNEVFRDDQYGDQSHGAAFAPDGRLATTALDGMIRLYKFDSNMRVETKGEFGGLGLQLTQENGLIKVVTAIEDTPAAKAGVLSDDVIMAIDDAPTAGLTLSQAVEKMRGAINSPVKLKIVRGPKKEVREFTIVRDQIRVQSNFRIGGAVRAPSGNLPFRVAFSPDGKRLAVGYYDVAAVDILDATTLQRVVGKSPVDAIGGLADVEWSGDGQTLLAAGRVLDAQGRTLIFAWDRGGLGDERRMTYCATNTATGVNALPHGRIFVASMAYCLGLINARGEPMWTVAAPILDLSWQRNVMRVSEDGRVVDFGYGGSSAPALRFDVRSLTLSRLPPNDSLTFAPLREGLPIDGWLNGSSPKLGGAALPLEAHDTARSLAVAPDAKRFFLGSSFALTAFDDGGAQKWRLESRNEVWAANASRDGRLVVAAYADGTIRWHRADDGRELLALQVLPNKNEPAKWDWVLWTPEGFYEATAGAQDVLKWVVNHGPDSPATTLPVSAIPKLHRPDALRLVLDELETARALGIADMAAARCDVQTATGSAKPPGEVLHVLAIGIDHFGEGAGDLHLDYAVDDARDVATALVESQKHPPCRPSLYADVRVVTLTDATQEKPTRENIIKEIGAVAHDMQRSGSGQDVALVLLSTHGAMVDKEFYLIPYGVDLTEIGATALSVTDLARSVEALAEAGKVILLVDACHAGAVGPEKLDASVLNKLVTMDTVTVLTSSKKFESSLEDKRWGHGAFTKAFLDALSGAADTEGRGTIRMGDLAMAMDGEVERLTEGKQHLGPHVNFFRDEVFVDNR